MDTFSTASVVISALALLVSFYSLRRSQRAITEANNPAQIVGLKQLIGQYDEALDEKVKRQQAQLARYSKIEKELSRVFDSQAPEAVPEPVAVPNGGPPPAEDREAAKAALRAQALAAGHRGV